jgi:hypothetical protein
MNTKTVFTKALLLTAVCVGSVRAQPPSARNPLDTVAPPSEATYNAEAAPKPQQTQSTLQPSSWILGDKYTCACNAGGGGPVESELFFRIGPTISFGGGQMAEVLQAGWYVGGGARALFFDQPQTQAWTVELGVANIYNHASQPVNGIQLNILVPPGVPVSFGKNGVPGVTVASLNRTYADLGGGHEWYMWGSAGCHGPSWRIGCDTGGRWGSERATFNEIPHRTDVIGGVWVAAHTDFECPCGACCIFQAGFRLEYGYTWSDILQIQNKSDVQDVNILFNMGVRF